MAAPAYKLNTDGLDNASYIRRPGGPRADIKAQQGIAVLAKEMGMTDPKALSGQWTNDFNSQFAKWLRLQQADHMGADAADGWLGKKTLAGLKDSLSPDVYAAMEQLQTSGNYGHLAHRSMYHDASLEELKADRDGLLAAGAAGLSGGAASAKAAAETKPGTALTAPKETSVTTRPGETGRAIVDPATGGKPGSNVVELARPGTEPATGRMMSPPGPAEVVALRPGTSNVPALVAEHPAPAPRPTVANAAPADAPRLAAPGGSSGQSTNGAGEQAQARQGQAGSGPESGDTSRTFNEKSGTLDPKNRIETKFDKIGLTPAELASLEHDAIERAVQQHGEGMRNTENPKVAERIKVYEDVIANERFKDKIDAYDRASAAEAVKARTSAAPEGAPGHTSSPAPEGAPRLSGTVEPEAKVGGLKGAAGLGLGVASVVGFGAVMGTVAAVDGASTEDASRETLANIPVLRATTEETQGQAIRTAVQDGGALATSFAVAAGVAAVSGPFAVITAPVAGAVTYWAADKFGGQALDAVGLTGADIDDMLDHRNRQVNVLRDMEKVDPTFMDQLKHVAAEHQPPIAVTDEKSAVVALTTPDIMKHFNSQYAHQQNDKNSTPDQARQAKAMLDDMGDIIELESSRNEALVDTRRRLDGQIARDQKKVEGYTADQDRAFESMKNAYPGFIDDLKKLGEAQQPPVKITKDAEARAFLRNPAISEYLESHYRQVEAENRPIDSSDTAGIDVGGDAKVAGQARQMWKALDTFSDAERWKVQAGASLAQNQNTLAKNPELQAARPATATHLGSAQTAYDVMAMGGA